MISATAGGEIVFPLKLQVSRAVSRRPSQQRQGISNSITRTQAPAAESEFVSRQFRPSDPDELKNHHSFRLGKNSSNLFSRTQKQPVSFVKILPRRFKKEALLSKSAVCGLLNKNRVTRGTAYHDILCNRTTTASYNPLFENFTNLYGKPRGSQNITLKGIVNSDEANADIANKLPARFGSSQGKDDDDDDSVMSCEFRNNFYTPKKQWVEDNIRGSNNSSFLNPERRHSKSTYQNRSKMDSNALPSLSEYVAPDENRHETIDETESHFFSTPRNNHIDEDSSFIPQRDDDTSEDFINSFHRDWSHHTSDNGYNFFDAYQKSNESSAENSVRRNENYSYSRIESPGVLSPLVFKDDDVQISNEPVDEIIDLCDSSDASEHSYDSNSSGWDFTGLNSSSPGSRMTSQNCDVENDINFLNTPILLNSSSPDSRSTSPNCVTENDLNFINTPIILSDGEDSDYDFQRDIYQRDASRSKIDELVKNGNEVYFCDSNDDDVGMICGSSSITPVMKSKNHPAFRPVVCYVENRRLVFEERDT